MEIPDKRSVLMGNALRLFSAHGYRAVGIDRIVAESGVAKMTLYKHFPSKEALILAVLEERDRVFLHSLRSHVMRQPEGRARLAAVFEWHGVWFSREDFRGCLFINAVAEHDGDSAGILDLAARHKRDVVQLLNEVLVTLSAPRVAGEMANQLSLLIDGAIVAAQVSRRLDAAEEAWAAARVLLDAKPARKAI